MDNAAMVKGAAFQGLEAADRLFAPPRVDVVLRADGSRILRSPAPLGSYPRCVGEWLVKWAREAPEQIFLAERPDGDTTRDWVGVTYREALSRVEAIATWILHKGLGPEHPVAILSDNSIEHALLSLAAMHVGVPVAAVSPAYSLMSANYEKLAGIIELLQPGAIYVPDAGRFAGALAAIAPLIQATLIVGTADSEAKGYADRVHFRDME